MRIDLRLYDTASLEQTQRANVKDGIKTKPPTTDGDVSSDVRLSGLETQVASMPEIRQGRVDQLRQAIKAGTYSVTDEQLASAMLGDHLR